MHHGRIDIQLGAKCEGLIFYPKTELVMSCQCAKINCGCGNQIPLHNPFVNPYQKENGIYVPTNLMQGVYVNDRAM